MSHFYGSMDGSAKTTATRCGTSDSGIRAHVRGWDTGVYIDGTNPNGDQFDIQATYGSNMNGRSVHIGTVKENADGTVSFCPSEQVIQAVKTAEGGELRF